MLFPARHGRVRRAHGGYSVRVFAIVSALSIAVLAPINEEIVCRIVMLECAMRAIVPAGMLPTAHVTAPFPPARSGLPNVLQALAFGVLHMNLIQGGYAFVLGAVLAGVLAHGQASLPDHPALRDERLVVFVEPLYPLLSAVPTGLVIVFAAVMFALGMGVRRLWSSSDVLDSIERPQDVAAVQGILPVEGEVGDRPTPAQRDIVG